MNLSVAVTSTKPLPVREWLYRGDPDCVHYWIGTGARELGRETFVCSRCKARMSEPLELSPMKREKPRVPRGFAPCSLCDGVFHWSRLVKGAGLSGRICMNCLEKIATGDAA